MRTVFIPGGDLLCGHHEVNLNRMEAAAYICEAFAGMGGEAHLHYNSIQNEVTMKKVSILLLLLFTMILAACAPAENTAEAELRATLLAVNVQQTVQAQEIETLTSQLAQPTATCPVCTVEVPSAIPPQPTATIVTTTPEPTATQAPTARPTGSLSGKLGYPSEAIPPLRIVAFNTLTGEYYWQNAVTNQSTYRFTELPAATYHVLSYLIDEPSKTFYAGYSNFVTCGMGANCADHNLVAVEVVAGQETTGIDPVDWYATDPAAMGWPLDPTIKWDKSQD